MRGPARPFQIAFLILGLFLMADAASSSGAPGISTTPKAGESAAAPSAPQTFSGTGSKVTNHFKLTAGTYKVAWTATGKNNFIVHVHGDDDSGIINEIPPDPASGETVFKAAGGDYFLEVTAATLKWTITFSPA